MYFQIWYLKVYFKINIQKKIIIKGKIGMSMLGESFCIYSMACLYILNDGDRSRSRIIDNLIYDI